MGIPVSMSEMKLWNQIKDHNRDETLELPLELGLITYEDLKSITMCSACFARRTFLIIIIDTTALTKQIIFEIRY